MVTADRPPANGFVAALRKVYNPLGFAKGYNATLWFIFDGALLGFTLARMPYFNYEGIFCSPDSSPTLGAAPGECYQYSLATYRRVGIQIHLFGILLATLFVVFQFIPAIRHKAMIVHRIMGYMAIIFSIVGVAGALMLTNFAFGGDIETQVSFVFLSIVFLAALGMAMYNVKRLQIDQHRAWMLRAWFYACTIITQRIILAVAATVISMDNVDPYHKAMPCGQILDLNSRNITRALTRYPACVDSNAYAVVQAKLGATAEGSAAALELCFGMGVWLGLSLHAIGIEIYLRLTPAESERLRRVSYQKQLERGFRNPGSAGLTAERIGDSDGWTAPLEKRSSSDYSGAFVKQESHDLGNGPGTQRAMV